MADRLRQKAIESYIELRVGDACASDSFRARHFANGA